MRLSVQDAAALARVINGRSPEIDVSPGECALFDKLFAFFLGRVPTTDDWSLISTPIDMIESAASTVGGEIELSSEEAALAAQCVKEAIPCWAKDLVRLHATLRSS